MATGQHKAKTIQEERPFEPRKRALTEDAGSRAERCVYLRRRPDRLMLQVETSFFKYVVFVTGGGVARGAAAIIRNRRTPPFTGRRRGQGVITGLAARRPGTIVKRAGALNRAALNQVLCQLFKNKRVNTWCSPPTFSLFPEFTLTDEFIPSDTKQTSRLAMKTVKWRKRHWDGCTEEIWKRRWNRRQNKEKIE